jgi:hypothetical protein
MSEVKTYIKKDHAGKGLIFRREQDATPVIQQNHEAERDQANDLRFGRRFASVPMVILEKWIEEGIDYRLISKDPKMARAFKQKLSDPEFKYFRTHYNDL